MHTEQPSNLPYELCVGVVDCSNAINGDVMLEAIENVVGQIETTLRTAMESPCGKTGAPKTLLQKCDTSLARVARPILKCFDYEIPVPAKRVAVTQQTPLSCKLLLTEQNADMQRLVEMIAKRVTKTSSTLLTASLPGMTSVSSEEHDSEAANHWVVDFSEILIMIWDGQLGATGMLEFIDRALHKCETVVWIDPTRAEPIPRILNSIEVPISNTDSEFPESPVEPKIKTCNLPQHAVHWSRRFHCLTAYHRDPAEDSEKTEKNSSRESEMLTALAADVGLSDYCLKPVLEKLLPIYARADHLANVYQGLYVLSAKWLFRFSALAVSIVAAQILFFPEQLWIISFEIGAMLLAIGLMRIARNEAWHEKWLNNRHFGEWLRTSLFTVMLKDSQADQFAEARASLPFYRCPDNWFIDTYRPLIEEVRQTIPVGLPFESLKRYLIDGWIISQANWHASNVKKKQASAHRNHQTGIALFAVTLLMAVLHLCGVGHADHAVETQQHSVSLNEMVGLGITFFAIILPAWGAAVHAVGNLLEHDRIATRSLHMSRVLNQIVDEAKAASNIEELKQAISRAEELMATENHEWLVSLSFRSIETPGF